MVSEPGYSPSFEVRREPENLDPEDLGLLSTDNFSEIHDRAQRVGDRLTEVLPDLRTSQPVKDSLTGQIDYREKPLGEWIGSCYSKGKVQFNEDGETSWRPKRTCGNYSKICPHHARLEVARRIEKYLPVILDEFQENDGHLRFVTFSLPNAEPGNLDEIRERTWDCWNRFRRRKAIEIEAGLMAEEVTVNPEDGSWNHHLHGILNYSSSPEYGTIGDEWRDVIGNPDAPNPEHRPIYHSAKRLKKSVKEVIKYLSKFETKDEGGLGLLDWSADHLREWRNVFWGRRTLRTYGDWYNAAADEAEDDQEDFEAVGEILMSWCDEAGKMTLDLIRVHKSTDPSVLGEVLNLDEEAIRLLMESASDPPYSNSFEIEKKEIDALRRGNLRALKG